MKPSHRQVLCIVLIVILIGLQLKQLKTSEEYCRWNNECGGGESCCGGNCRTGSCPAPNCFTGESLVTMADGSHKPIAQIVVGDWVRSGKSLASVRVQMINHIAACDGVLVGFNELAPFATSNHAFLSANGTRLARDVDKSFQTTREHAFLLENGCNLMNGEHQSMPVSELVEQQFYHLPLYDLFTEDGSFIVNDRCVFDSFPPITKYPVQSIRIFTMVLLSLSHPTWSDDKLLEQAQATPVEDHVDLSVWVQLFLKMAQLDHRVLHLAHLFWVNHFDHVSPMQVESDAVSLQKPTVEII